MNYYDNKVKKLLKPLKNKLETGKLDYWTNKGQNSGQPITVMEFEGERVLLTKHNTEDIKRALKIIGGIK